MQQLVEEIRIQVIIASAGLLQLRILIISNYYPPAEIGGWGQLTKEVTDGLAAREHEIHVLTSNYLVGRITTPESDVSRILNLESPDHVNYHIPYTFLRLGWENKNIAHLHEFAENLRPEIIYINGMWNLPLSLAQAAEHVLPGRVVYYMASYWPTEMDAHSAYWSLRARNDLKRFTKDILGKIFMRYFISGTPRNQLDFRLVLCVSSYVQDYIVGEVKVPRERTRVVHNGINLDFFKLNPKSDGNGLVRLLYAGRLSADKGVHTILESLNILSKKRSTSAIKCSIYGSGSPSYQANLARYVEENGLEALVDFNGVVPRDKMPDVLADHDVLLFPSVWAEPLARIIQEAMACGLIVIGTITGGTGEILQDGVTGLTFEAGNAKMLAEKITQVQEDLRLRERIIRKARQKVEQEYSFPRMLDEIEESFEWLLSK